MREAENLSVEFSGIFWQKVGYFL
uniref:Uncharacterized protein n=1 Tax=mine drainage metagenome TaxID=410659 RepID=E6QKP6_9ZZZZ